MKLNPHVSFGGQCEVAFRFYERCLGGEIITMLTYGNSPMAEQVPPEFRGKIVHATLTLGASVLYGADVVPDRYQPPSGFHLTIGLDDPDQAEVIFHALSENGIVQMPLQKTFWAVLFGVLVDQFGVSWEINCARAE